MAPDYASRFRGDHVLIKNADGFNRKVARIIADGLKDLQCVFDFDATVSKAFHNGKLVSNERGLSFVKLMSRRHRAIEHSKKRCRRKLWH